MAKKKPRIDDSVILFDVIYEDGTRSSRRKVAAADLADSDGDDHAKTLIMAQDREIAKMSGNQRGTVKTITRSPTEGRYPLRAGNPVRKRPYDPYRVSADWLGFALFKVLQPSPYFQNIDTSHRA
jgi:hypothetical protein